MVKKIEYKVKNPQGIHARPAGLLVSEFNKFKCNIIIKKGEKSVNAKEIFSLMSLSIKQGDTITITFEGEDQEESAKSAEKFIKKLIDSGPGVN
ncbi:MAG: HPr family phosphocarrier protein [Clostridiaceae bacterium]